MAAVPEDLYIDQGATYSFGFVYCEPQTDTDTGEPVLDADGNPIPGPAKSLAGCSARMQIRSAKTGGSVLLQATSATDDSEGAGRILIEPGAETGRIQVILTDLDTDQLTAKKAYYDFELVWPLQVGELRPRVDRLLQGIAYVDLNTTQDA